MISINEFIMSTEIGFIYGLVAIGIFLTFRIINFADLTCDGSITTGAAVSSALLLKGFTPLTAFILAFMAGSVAGGITGLLNLKLKISPLLSGILTAFILYSINLKIMGDIPNLTLTTPSPTFLTLMIITLTITTLMAYLLNTDFGLALRSIGQNQRFSHLMGINISLFTMIGLVLSNGLIALAGALFSQYQGFSDINSGMGTLVVGLASIIIGERILPFRSLWLQVLACILGSILYRLLVSLALHSDTLGIQSQDLNLVTGILIVGIMTLSRRKTWKTLCCN